MRSGFVIITDSRKKNEVLFMVDRARQHKSFWSNCTKDVFVFIDKTAAKTRAKSLRFNNPKVITLRDAHNISRKQRLYSELQNNYFSLQDDYNNFDDDLSWDAHKKYC